MKSAFASATVTGGSIRSVCPKTRKRFYVMKSNDGGLAIINLRHLISGAGITNVISIVGPFRSFNDAVRRLEVEAGVTHASY